MSQTDPGLIIVPNFSRVARALRREFDTAFGDPLRATASRFVWDYWNLPGQYTLLRTAPSSVFSHQSLASFSDELSAWAQENLGLSTISEPWLSCYVEGCEQRFHTDAAHGPWAFVYSLTPPIFAKKAQGGFTRIARDFGSPQLQRPREELDLFCDVDSRFDRLVVFDPRRPHAVERVRGVQDLREGRLVIHGWFTDPQPFYTAKLSKRVATEALTILEEAVSEALKELGRAVQGLGVLRAGPSAKVEWVSSLLVDTERLSYISARDKANFLKLVHAELAHKPRWREICRELGPARLTFPFECTS